MPQTLEHHPSQAPHTVDQPIDGVIVLSTRGALARHLSSLPSRPPPHGSAHLERAVDPSQAPSLTLDLANSLAPSWHQNLTKPILGPYAIHPGSTHTNVHSMKRFQVNSPVPSPVPIPQLAYLLLHLPPHLLGQLPLPPRQGSPPARR